MDVACKICGTAASLHGVVDFNKCCEWPRKRYLPLSGVPVWYHRCGSCGFLFTSQFDHWTTENWRTAVYNDQYAAIDPDGSDGSRARNNADLVSQYMGSRNYSTLLDYGGGDGTLARSIGNGAVSWDPFLDESGPSGTFDLVTAFEVFEHTPTPHETARNALSFLNPGGTLIFSTLLMDDLEPFDCGHWYLAPRNGHISLHTTKSLARLFWPDWIVSSFASGYHMAMKV